MNLLLANFIRCLHMLLIIFVVFAPFTKDSLVIFLNIVIMASIMVHWFLNNQVCCLTELEKMCRGKECDSETFFGQLVGPVYSANTENQFAWSLMIFLFLFNLKKMYDYREDFSDKLKKIYNLFINKEHVDNSNNTDNK